MQLQRDRGKIPNTRNRENNSNKIDKINKQG